MAERVPPEIRVISLKTRYGFDGQTGIVTLKGTPGTVGVMTLHKRKARLGRDHDPDPIATLTVFWDASILQDANNDDPSNYEGFEEADIDIADVQFIGSISGVQPHDREEQTVSHSPDASPVVPVLPRLGEVLPRPLDKSEEPRG